VYRIFGLQIFYNYISSSSDSLSWELSCVG